MGAERAHATFPRGREGRWEERPGWENRRPGSPAVCTDRSDSGARALLLGAGAILLPELGGEGGAARGKGRDEDSGHPCS